MWQLLHCFSWRDHTFDRLYTTIKWLFHWWCFSFWSMLPVCWWSWFCWKEHLKLQCSLISALLFRLLACMLSNLLKWCCPSPSVYAWNRVCFARNVVSALAISGVGLRYSLAQWGSSCVKIALYTNIQKKIFKVNYLNVPISISCL